MASSINASTSAGLVSTADLSGVLQLQSNGTTIATISSTGLQTNVGAPAFSYYATTTTSCAAGTNTKVNFAGKNFDTANCFSNSRFTPTVAGYYQINCSLRMEGINNYQAILYLNGSAAVGGNNPQVGSFCNTVSALLYMNGTTDYIEMYCFNGNGSTQTISAFATQTIFSGVMVRSA